MEFWVIGNDEVQKFVKLTSRTPVQPFFWGEKLPKGDTVQIFWRKSPFFLKSIRQSALLFKERVATSMPTDYTFNAPEEKYRQLGVWGYSPVLRHLKSEKKKSCLVWQKD